MVDYRSGTAAWRAIRLLLALSFGLALAVCGKEGPFGNTPGPKKPAWHYQPGPLN